MIIDNSKVKAHLSNLKSQLNEGLKEIEELIEKECSMQNPNDLEKVESAIINKTDKLASLILSCKIQESLSSDHELKQESSNLIRSFPKKMKNQGIRDVEICPLKGEPFIVKTEYFTQKAKKDKRKKKEPAVIHP